MRSWLKQTACRRIFTIAQFSGSSNSSFLKDIMTNVSSGKILPEYAVQLVEERQKRIAKDTSILVGNFANLDTSRSARVGFPEVIFGSGKTAMQIIAIFDAFLEQGMRNDMPIIATRVSPPLYREIHDLVSVGLSKHQTDFLVYNETAQILSTLQCKDSTSPRIKKPGKVVVMCAGTSDIGIAEEAAVLLELSGVNSVTRIYDVGVAGLHRLLGKLDEFIDVDVVSFFSFLVELY